MQTYMYMYMHIYIFIYTAICTDFEPPKIYIDIYLFLRVHLFSRATSRKHCFPCDISMELPGRCESRMLGHISHFRGPVRDKFRQATRP